MEVPPKVARSLKATGVVAAHTSARRDATLEEVYHLAFPRLYAFLRSQVPRAEIAEDLLSRVLVKAYNHWHDRSCDEHTTAWLFKAARTTLIDYWRVEGRRERVTVSLEELENAPAIAADPEAALMLRERQRHFIQVISDLDADQRILLGMRFVGGCTNREMASVLGISDAAVSMRLLRALRVLRDRLLKVGLP